MARLLTTTGISRWIFPSHPDRRDFSLEDIKWLLQGEAPECAVVPVADFRYGSCHMIINDLAAHYGLPVNEAASVLCRREILGPALLVASYECLWGNDPLDDLMDWP